MRKLAFFTGAVALLAACGGGSSGNPATTTTGSTTGSSNTGGAGGSPDREFPAPIIAGTKDTDALAAAPARCGQPAYAWLKDAKVGHVTASEERAAYTTATLESLASAAGVALPAAPIYDVDTHVVTYVTQDRGQPIEATTLVAWPTSVPEGTAALPTLVVLHGTSGFTDGCGPTTDTATAVLAAALASLGYVVVVPDYIGLKAVPPPTGFLHPYLAGQATAIAALDAVRALGDLPANVRVGGARPSPRVLVVGGSQGGHAALWVDRLAPYYARELEILGIAATVPPADMLGEATLALTMLRQSSGNMAAFYGATAGWYGAADKLAEVFVPPLDKDVPTALGASCDPGAAVKDITSLDVAFQKPLLDAAAAGTLGALAPWGCMVTENGLTTTSIARVQKDPASFGILFVTGEADQLVDTPTERVAFATLCQAGMPLQYLECAGASHTQTTGWALPEILAFLADRAAGKPFTPSCTVGAPVACQGAPKP